MARIAHSKRTLTWTHDFPTELWSSEVVPKLDPVDVLSLGQTCRALRSILHCLSIWRSILVSVCATHGLFLPSYPMDEMGIEELQRASLSPLRWRRLVQKHAVLVRDLEDAVPLPVKQSSDELWPYWMALSLVPGGRFLAMINGNRDFRRLEMWDLGLPGQGPQPNPSLLAFTDSYALSECYELFVCPDGDSLTIATSHIPLKDSQKAQLFEVFSFTPSAISPEFVKLASHRLTLTDEVETSVVGKRALFMQSNSSCILCDFERSLFVHWRFEPTSAAFASLPAGLRPIFLTRDHAFVLGRTGAFVWRLSSLEPHSQLMPKEVRADTMIPQNIPPDLIVRFPGQTIGDTHERFTVSFSSPVLGSVPSITFDIFEERSSRLHLIRYAISDPECTPQAKLVSAGYFERDKPFNHLSFMRGDTSYAELEREGCLRTFLYDGQARSSKDSLMHSVEPTVTALQPNMMLWASCAASGRFIYNKHDPAMENPPTVIIDYL